MRGGAWGHGNRNSASSGIGGGGSLGSEKRHDRGRLMGTFVRKGDRIELEHTEHSGARKGAKTSLMMRPRDYGGGWEVRVLGSVSCILRMERWGTCLRGTYGKPPFMRWKTFRRPCRMRLVVRHA